MIPITKRVANIRGRVWFNIGETVPYEVRALLYHTLIPRVQEETFTVFDEIINKIRLKARLNLPRDM